MIPAILGLGALSSAVLAVADERNPERDGDRDRMAKKILAQLVIGTPDQYAEMFRLGLGDAISPYIAKRLIDLLKRGMKTTRLAAEGPYRVTTVGTTDGQWVAAVLQAHPFEIRLMVKLQEARIQFERSEGATPDSEARVHIIKRQIPMRRAPDPAWKDPGGDPAWDDPALVTKILREGYRYALGSGWW